MKTGASISGGVHAALIAAAIFAGELFSDEQTTPLPIAEVELMSGAEFEAAQSVAPEFNPDLPSAPKAPDPGETRADIEIAEENAAPVRASIAAEPDAPQPGDDVAPLERTPTPDVSVADIGDQPSAPPAPEDSVLIAAPPTADGASRVAVLEPSPAPAPRTQRPSADTATPDTSPAPPPIPVAAAPPEPASTPTVADAPSPPEPPKPEEQPQVARVEPSPVIEPEPVTAPEPEVKPEETAELQPEPAPQPQPDVQPEPDRQTEPEPEPEPEPEITRLNDPDETAPTLAPAPARKPKDVADAKKAVRLAREAEAAKTGATQKAETSQGGGTSRTVGNLSFRDKDALRLGIKGNFNPPQGLANANSMQVVIRIRLSPDGKIIGKPELRRPRSPDNAHRALMGAGMRALLKSAAKGVFKRLPKDKHAKWQIIDVTFTPKEIQFL